MPAIERHIRIQAPVDVVWRVLVDVPGQPRWMRDLVSVRIETPGPLRVGTVATGTVQMFGLVQADPIRVTRLDAPECYAIEHLGGFTGWGELRLWPVDAGRATHLRWREALRPGPSAFPVADRLASVPLVGARLVTLSAAAMRLADPLLWPVFSFVFRADLRRLKRLVETGRA
jgi:hypothetical protein